MRVEGIWGEGGSARTLVRATHAAHVKTLRGLFLRVGAIPARGLKLIIVCDGMLAFRSFAAGYDCFRRSVEWLFCFRATLP